MRLAKRQVQQQEPPLLLLSSLQKVGLPGDPSHVQSNHHEQQTLVILTECHASPVKAPWVESAEELDALP